MTTAGRAFVASSSKKVNLMNILSLPSKVASALDWRKLSGSSLLTLALHTDRIEAIAAHHPSCGEMSSTVESLPISKNGRVIPEFTKQRLKDIIKEQNVCGIVVSLPIQRDTGKLGYAAGRTLWMLERLFLQDEKSRNNNNNKTTNTILPPNRPVCLWDGVHAVQPPIDEWGRSSVYARTSSKLHHSASQEQYHQDEGIAVTKVSEDFMRTNWPNIYRHHPTPLLKYSQSQHHRHNGSLEGRTTNEDWNNLYGNDNSSWEGMAV
jgi:hypothetical protein